MNSGGRICQVRTALRSGALALLLGTAFAAPAAAAAPTASTGVVTQQQTGTSARLNGSANPNNEPTTAWFRYSTVSPGTCNDSFGTREPAADGTDVGAGPVAITYFVTATGLSPGTTYFYCAVAANASGTSFGAVLSFTAPSPPTITTSTAGPVGSTTATLNGTGNPNGSSATGWFRYSASNPGVCSDSFGTRTPPSGGTNLGAGVAAQPFSGPVTGLSPGTTYFFCAIGSNSVGTSFGSVLSFTTATPPTVSTSAASGLTSTSATLNGSANPNRASATGWFRYGTSDPGVCTDSFGIRVPASGGAFLGAGSAPVSYAQGITGLAPGTSYFVCAVASNSVGTSFGAVVSFTTPALAPTVSTSATTSRTDTGATLNGSANPNGAATTGWFRYSTVSPGACNDSFGTRAPSSGGSALGAGNNPVAFSQAVTGLTPLTTYFACPIAENSAGMTFGPLTSFTTAGPPTASTAPVTDVTTTTATLVGTGNPNGATATGWFRYGVSNPGACDDAFGTRTPASGGSNLGAGVAEQRYQNTASGLTPGTTYFFCAIVQNVNGTAFGSVASFTTAAAPAVTTSAASAVTSTSATLNGSANPNRVLTTGWFRFATTDPGVCTDSFGTREPASSGAFLGAGSMPVDFSRAVTGLLPGTTYFYCAVAENSVGTRFGAVQSFTTPARAPSVSTSSTTLRTATSATLNGSGDPGGAATTGWFRYSTASPGTCNDSFGTRAPVTGGSALGSGNGSVAFSQAATGLSPMTTYFYCAIAENSVGTAFGPVLSFTTAGPPVASTSAATSITSSAATLNGSGSPNGAVTTGWFRYSATDPVTCTDTFGTREPGTGGSNLGTGNGTVAYSRSPSGLTPGTTYFFCAIVENVNGTAFGPVLSFTTLDAPSVATGAASAVSSTGATLNGSANPNGAEATGWLRHSTTDPGVCTDSFGTRVPASGGSALGSGSMSVDFSRTVTGLSPGTTYFYCAIAESSVGTRFGQVLSFTTLATEPSVTTSSATLRTATGATLTGSGNPNGAATTGWFRYSTVSPGTCNDSFGTRAPLTGGSALGSGNGSVAFSQAVTGLSPLTTYFYCAIASNTEGTSLGALLSFTTAGAPEATTAAATAVAAGSAILNGTGDPNGAAATGWFRYATTNPGACNDAFGTRTPASGGSALGAGTSPQSFTAAPSGLSPGTTYFFCAIVQNVDGTAFGSVLSFRTLDAPSVVTAAASSVTSSGATLNGSADPNGAATTGWLRYSASHPGVCTDTFGTRAPASGGASLGSGSAPVGYSQAVAGLQPGTTYFFCAIAENSVGIRFGTVQSFTTPATAPSVSTSSATLRTATGATLNGSATPNGAATTAWFRYSTVSPGTCNDSFGTRAPSTGGSALGAGNNAATFSQAVSGLSPSTTYFFCAIAENASGVSVGTLLSFLTASLPSASSAPATSVTSSGATLNGSGTPNGAATTAWFRYSVIEPGACNDTFGTRAPASGGTSLGAGGSPVPFSESLAGLLPGTTYFFCAIASSSAGTAFGSVVSFTTAASKPTVTTAAASAVTATGAALNGSANPNGAATTGWLRYSSVDPGTCNDTFGARAPVSGGSVLGAGTGFVDFARNVSGLSPGTTYFFCAIASNSEGTSFGSVLSFTTAVAKPSVATVEASAVTATGAALNGSANPNGATATGWLRYSPTDPGTCNDGFGTRLPATGGASLGGATSSVPFSEAASGLSPGRTYFFCAIASNSEGTSFGSVLSFTTAASRPTVTTAPASAVSAAGASLNGSASSNGAASTAWLAFGTSDPGTCDAGFGTRLPATGGTALAAGATDAPFAESTAGLVASTTYFFCAVAQNSAGTTFGAVRSFTTAAAPPPDVVNPPTTDPGGDTTPPVTTPPTTTTPGTTPPVLTIPPGAAVEFISARKAGRKLTVKLRVRRAVTDLRLSIKRVGKGRAVVLAKRSLAKAARDVTFTLTLPRARTPNTLRLEVDARESSGKLVSFKRTLALKG